MKYEKPYKGKLHIGCLTCSTASWDLEMDRILAVGFGDAIASKNGKTVYSEMEFMRGKKDIAMQDIDWVTAQVIEDMALKEPDCDWRIQFIGPMHGESYQRQDGKWVLIDSNQGFA